jgi:type IV secretion system protein VirB8
MNAISKRTAVADAFQARPVPDDPELLAAYFRQVASYEGDRLKAARRSAKFAWSVAIGASIVAGAACFAIAGLTPLKTVVPIVFRVDNSTGMVDRVYDVRGGELAASEAERRYFLWQYVRLRQGYTYAEAQQNFDAVNLMSTALVQQQYAEWFRGSNAASPQVLLGRYGMATVNWVSTQFSPVNPKVAFVRFIQQERKGDSLLPSKHMIATIGFDFAKGSISGSALNVNPDGFLVTSYHADEEAQ